MKPLIYAVVAASVVGFSAGAYAHCGAAHTASAGSSVIVAQQQTGTPAQGSQSQGSGAAGQSN